MDKLLVRGERPLAKQVEKTVEYLLRFPPAHSALRMTKIQGTRDIYEFSLNMDIRMTFEFSDPETILLRNIDPHDPALKRY